MLIILEVSPYVLLRIMLLLHHSTLVFEIVDLPLNGSYKDVVICNVHLLAKIIVRSVSLISVDVVSISTIPSQAAKRNIVLVHLILVGVMDLQRFLFIFCIAISS